MFEKMRAKWTKAIHPLVLRMGDLDPSTLTWASLLLAIVAFYLLSGAGADEAVDLRGGGVDEAVALVSVFMVLQGFLKIRQGFFEGFLWIFRISMLGHQVATAKPSTSPQGSISIKFHVIS